KYCEDSARFIFGDAIGDPVADTILEELRAAADHGLTRTEISSLFNRNVKASKIKRALWSLVETKLAYYKKERPAGSDRPAERWFATKTGEEFVIRNSSTDSNESLALDEKVESSRITNLLANDLDETGDGLTTNYEFPQQAIKVDMNKKQIRNSYKGVVDPKNWTVFDQQHTVQKGESTDAKTSYFQTRIQGPRRPPGSDRGEDRCSGLS